MKIIKPGTVPEPLIVVYIGTCYNCHCEFEADDSDMKEPDRGGM